MRRGHMANTLQATLWVHEEVLTTTADDGAVSLRRLDWLWRVSCRFSPLIVCFSAQNLQLLSDYPCEVFPSFAEARARFIRDMRSTLFIVDRADLVSPPDILLFDKSTGT
jgi:hypothetical protein